MSKIILFLLSSLLANDLSAQVDTIFQTDFSPSTNFYFESQTGMDWIVEDQPPGSTRAASMGVINSTSGGDFALFDSGAFGTQGTYQYSTIWIDEYVDCSAYPYMYARFESYYKHFNGTAECHIRTSQNAITGVFAYFLGNNNVFTTANPETVFVDITQAVAGIDSIMIGFRYGGYYSYAWMVDDLSIIGSNVPLIAGNENLVSLEKNFSVYPNPSDGTFSIDMTSFVGDVKLRISDLQGRIIRTEFVDANVDSYDIFLDGIPGVYMISAIDETGESTAKIVKN